MLHKKAFYLFNIICLLISFSLCASALDVSAKSAVVLNGKTNEVVFEKNCKEQLSMASTTKIMTSLLACMSGKMNDIVTVETKTLSGIEGTAIGLKAGYKMSLRNLVYGMMLESGNDAAQAAAVYLGGSVNSFAARMNSFAKEIGMTDSNFVTPSGLDSENHYSTAYDMAILGAFALKNPEFKTICSTKSITVDFVEPQLRVTFSNHNKLLSYLNGTIGIKTGFTKKSGRCLVSAAERDGIRFVAVTLNAPNDWSDHKKMLEYAFENVKEKTIELNLPHSIHIEGAKQNSVSIKALQNPVSVSYNSDLGNLSVKVFLPSFVYAPVDEGDILGCAEIYGDEKLIETVDIVATEKIDSIEESYVPQKSILEKIKEKINNMFDSQENKND